MTLVKELKMEKFDNFYVKKVVSNVLRCC